MRNISFALTTPQFIAGTKDVTRRLGWSSAKVGDRYMGCEKCQGIKKGGLVRLGVIEVIHVHQQPLQLMIDHKKWGDEEAKREGFPHLTGAQFVEHFCANVKRKDEITGKTRLCIPSDIVTRIEFTKVSTLT